MHELYRQAIEDVRDYGFIRTMTTIALKAMFVDVAKLERYLLDEVTL
jgi:hypothetical protein